MEDDKAEIGTVEQRNVELPVIKKGSEVAISQPGDAMLAMIDRFCSEPNFDITKMEKFIEMRNVEMDRIAKINFSKAFAEMQGKLPTIKTQHVNPHTKSKYARLEDINKDILPVLKQHDFGVSFKILSQDKEHVTIQAILAHSGGHKESTDLSMPLDDGGKKTTTHAVGSTITYAKRYAMCMLLNISTGDDNDGNNNNTPNVITAQQVEEMNDLMEQTGIDKIKFTTEYLQVDSLPELHIKHYKKAMNALNLKLKKNLQEGKANANS